MAILTSVRGCYVRVLICIFVIIVILSIISCTSWPSVCLLWRNVYLDLLIFWLGWLVGLISSCMSCSYILEINLLSTALFTDIFSHFESFLFILFMVSFAAQKLSNLIRFHLFVFIFLILGGGSKKILLWFISKGIFPAFSSKSFIVSGLTFRSLANFEFIFVSCYGLF